MLYYKIDVWSHKTNKSSNKRTNKLKQHIQMVTNNKNEKKIFLTKKKKFILLLKYASLVTTKTFVLWSALII